MELKGLLTPRAWADLPWPHCLRWPPCALQTRHVIATHYGNLNPGSTAGFFSLQKQSLLACQANPGCSAGVTDSIRGKIARREIKSWMCPLHWRGPATSTDLSKRPDRSWVRILPWSLQTGENKGFSQQKATGGPTILLSVIKNIFLSTAQLSSFILLYPLPFIP